MSLFEKSLILVRDPSELRSVFGRVVFFPGWKPHDGEVRSRVNVPPDPNAPVLRGLLHAMLVDGVSAHRHVVARIKTRAPFRLGLAVPGKTTVVTERLFNGRRGRDEPLVMIRREDVSFDLFATDADGAGVPVDLAAEEARHTDLIGSHTIHIANWPEERAHPRLRLLMGTFGRNA